VTDHGPVPGRVRTAVLVDAENMACGLGTVDSRAAAVFAEHPASWLEWLIGLAYPAVQAWGPFRRQLLMRTCFLNSDTGRSLRPGFVRAGFDIVDCPALTSAGKNAADIHLVITMLDLLTHPTRYDEVILLSSDTDFTPALTRLRAHDRRTVVIASGPHTPALAAACDHLLPATDFAQALTTLLLPAVTTTAVGTAKKTTASKKATPAQKATPAKKAAVATNAAPVKKAITAKKTTSAKKTATATQTVTGATVSPVTDPLDVADDLVQARARVLGAVTALVSASHAPVALASLAQPVRVALGPRYTPGWAGAGGLKKLLDSLDLAGIIVGDKEPGYVYDPSRHRPPAVSTAGSPPPPT
jgi:hypothetical protein